jgi:hypothetical protein
MQLVMYLDNDFIAGIKIDEQRLSQPGYMGKLKRQLKEEHSQVLQTSSQQPEFLLVDFSGIKKG